MRLLQTIVVLLFAIALSCTFLTTQISSTTTIHSDPTHFILDEQQRICVLHGVNVSNFSKSSEGNLPWTDTAEYKWLEQNGFNAVRYVGQWAAMEPVPGTFDDYYFTQTARHIEKMAAAGILVVFDVHQDLYTKKFGGDGFPEWSVRQGKYKFGGVKEPWNLTYTDPAVLASYSNFWHNDTLQDKYLRMIDKVLSFTDTMPNVIGVDVMNEPFLDLSGSFERNKLTALYYKVQELIKQRAYSKTMFFEPWMGTSTGIASGLRYKAGIPAVYSPHYYDVFIEARNSYNQLVQRFTMQRAIDIKQREANEFKSALMFGEWGVPEEKYLPFVDDFLTEMDKHCASWMYWSYDKMQFNEYGIVDTAGVERQIVKSLVRPYPQRIAGRDPKFLNTADTLRLTFTNIGLDSPTVVFIPKNRTLVDIQSTGFVQIQGQKLIVWNNGQKMQWLRVVTHVY
jgi:endoglycosylceramidase